LFTRPVSLLSRLRPTKEDERNEVSDTRERDKMAKRIFLGKPEGLEVDGKIILSRVLVTSDAGLDW
jgi:hypothetical protein